MVCVTERKSSEQAFLVTEFEVSSVVDHMNTGIDFFQQKVVPAGAAAQFVFSMNQHTAFDHPHLAPIDNGSLQPLIGEHGAMRRQHLLAITRPLHRLQYEFKVAAYLPTASRNGTSEPHTLKHREPACDVLVPRDAKFNCWADNDV